MDIKQRKFRFVSSALKADTFEVIGFTGSEGLSKLYRFEVLLVSDNAGLDLEQVINSRATLTILRPAGDIHFHGILVSFEQLLSVNGHSQYRAVLVPLAWRLGLTHHNQVFLDSTVPRIIESALKDGGLTGLDYELRLTKAYPQREYVCMYNESHFSFISRWMEREGIYFYFEQGAGSERLIITDTALGHSGMPEGEKMVFSPVSGLDEKSREEVIKSFVCVQKALPARVTLKDYNYRKPSLELSATCEVSEDGIGDVYIYGEHFSTPEEGAALARVRAEELQCRARLFRGESLIPYLRPGYTFVLSEHFRKDFNVRYLTTDIDHSGSQAFYFSAGLRQTLSEREEAPYYRNSFAAILTDTQFRPERTAPQPRIPGTINAHIDAEGSGQYAELDSQGRYKVRLPFDLSESKGGKASSWLRMAQPYAGSNHGMHFPLHKGTEVLLTFIDGDPDRPIIAAAVTNPLTPSPVTEDNATKNVICSSAGNRMEMHDEAGSEQVMISTPFMNSCIRMGAPPLFGTASLGAAQAAAAGQQYTVSYTTQGSELLGSGLNMGISAGTFLESNIGSVNTPASTPTFFQAVDGSIGAPADGDYYLTTKARQVHNVGSDMIIQVAGRYSEIIAGTRNTHVKGDVYETFDTNLHQTVNGTVTKITKADEYHDVGKDHCVNVSGTGKHTWGAKENVFYGASSDVNLGAFSAVYVGARFQGHLASNTMMNLVNFNNINMGIILSATWALKLEWEKTITVKVGSAMLDERLLRKYDHAFAVTKEGFHVADGAGKVKRFLSTIFL
ncbi:MAG TPA: type VI secretion system tip protein TssI/VgrG [Spirochaetota bacterium]|nr:type VI secretion system tip protein TssI/VgrG [Spirochaetota bacterium]